MFVLWHMFVSFGTFDFGGNGAREDEQNSTLAHVMCKGFIQRCRRTLMFPSPTTYSKQLQWRTVLFRMAKRVVVWARVVHAKQHHLSSKVWVFCRLW